MFLQKDIVLHELGHAIGFYHEQSRVDRDNYLLVKWDNIRPANSFNFNRASTSAYSDYGVPYDYNSIMHYGPRVRTRIVWRHALRP